MSHSPDCILRPGPWPTMALSYRWSDQRQAFGKPLGSQAVIRSKLAQMIARVESAQSWLENVTHQMNNVRPLRPCLVLSFWTVSRSLLSRLQMSYNEQSENIAGAIALLKQ
jgi:alkylation response protein AidB-like acyl-CoA dehydrogenase